MLARAAIVLIWVVPVLAGEWDARLAARYLDGRAAEWAAWKNAQAAGGPCISCHTSLPYLLARPALRRRLREGTVTEFETNLVAGVKARATKQPAENGEGTQPVLAALILLTDEARRGLALSQEAETALDRMWSLQLKDGADKGAWRWAQFNLDPWETPESVYFGAALAAVAVGLTPSEYQNRPAIRPKLEALQTYLSNTERQPLANQLALLWGAARWKGLLTDAVRRRIIDDAWKAQGEDGAWTLAALGPWRDHPAAVPAPGASAYATALAAFLLRQAGTAPDDPKLRKSLAWLRRHQDPSGGFWDAASMNKRYPAGSMQERFMRDAATAYAVLALAEE